MFLFPGGFEGQVSKSPASQNKDFWGSVMEVRAYIAVFKKKTASDQHFINADLDPTFGSMISKIREI